MLQTRGVPTEENRRNLSLFARKEFQYSHLLSSQRERKASRRREILKGRCQRIFDSNILIYCLLKGREERKASRRREILKGRCQKIVDSNILIYCLLKGRERGKEGTEKRNIKRMVSKDW
jgi:hypothetical protein